MVTSENTDDKLAKLRWRCRRGMLELDMILQKFFDEEYAHMSQSKQDIFADLLEENDQDLHSWLLGKEFPENAKYQDLIMVIRHIYAEA